MDHLLLLASVLNSITNRDQVQPVRVVGMIEITRNKMQTFQWSIIILAVLYLVSQQELHSVQSSESIDDSRRQDDPTSMVASIGAQLHDSQVRSSTNVVYESSSWLSTKKQDDYYNIDWQIYLDRRQAINLGWSIDYARNEVLFELEINTTRTKFHRGSDIFALGFSDYGQIELADFCLLWFDLAHSIQMRDAITNSQGQLSVIDGTDSYCKLITATNDEEDENLLVYKFIRPLDTCQPNYYAIDNGTTHLIWFKLDGPLIDMNKINLSELQKLQQQEQHQQHGKQHKSTQTSSLFESGLTRVQLAATKVVHHNNNNNKSNSHHSSSSSSSEASSELSSSSSSSSLDVRMENYEIPARETTYWCKLFKLPHRFERRKFHITKYEAVIEKGNEHIVHHMELFNCVYENDKQAKDLRELYEIKGGWSGECGSKERPKASEICRRVILAWAMGAKPLEYPEQVGQSIGGQQYSPYVLLEIHYNNVELSQSLQDNSGLRFHFTHKLRPFDAGIMEVGLEYTDKNSIPPNVIAPLAGYCVSECTRAAMSASSSGASSSRGYPGSVEHDYGYLHRGHRHHHHHRGRSRSRSRSHEKRRHLGSATAAGHHHSRRLRRNNGLEEERGEKEEDYDDYYDDDQNNMEDEGEEGENSQEVMETENDDDYSAKRNNHQKENKKNNDNNKKGNNMVNKKHQQQEGIYIFAAQMHTHLAGVATWTEQIREGRVLRELQRDNHYSPHFQEIRLLPEPVHVAPGDALIHYCLYDTRERPNITLGGYSTSDEMCVTYLHYYPRIDLEVCKSSIDSRALEEYFLRLASEENQFVGLYNNDNNLSTPISSSTLSTTTTRRRRRNKLMLLKEELEKKSVSEKYQSIEWSKRRSNELLEFYTNAPLSVQCNRSNGDRFPGYWNGVTPTEVYWTNNNNYYLSGYDDDLDDDDDHDDLIAGDRAAAEGVFEAGAGPEAGAGVGAGEEEHQDDDPLGRHQLAAGYTGPHLGPQIMQYHGSRRIGRLRHGGHQVRRQTYATDRFRSSKCSFASLNKQRPQLV